MKPLLIEPNQVSAGPPGPAISPHERNLKRIAAMTDATPLTEAEYGLYLNWCREHEVPAKCFGDVARAKFRNATKAAYEMLEARHSSAVCEVHASAAPLMPMPGQPPAAAPTR